MQSRKNEGETSGARKRRPTAYAAAAIAAIALLAIGAFCGILYCKSTAEGPSTQTQSGNLTYQQDVSARQSTADYWISRYKDPDKVLVGASEIAAINEAVVVTPSTGVNDLAALANTGFDGNALREESLGGAF